MTTAFRYNRDIDKNIKYSKYKFSQRLDDCARKQHQAYQGKSFATTVTLRENPHYDGIQHQRETETTPVPMARDRGI